MQRKTGFFPTFLLVILICIVIFVLSLFGKLKFLSSFLEKGTSSVQAVTFGIFKKIPFMSESTRLKKLEEANLELLSRVVTFEKIKKENQALLDQFQTAYPRSPQLLQAQITGASAFVPGVSFPSAFVINKGSEDNLKVGMAVVVKDNLVGVVSRVSNNITQVNTVSNSILSLTAKTQNGAVGIVKGGNSLTLNNILLSENVSAGELVLTKGDVNIDGVGVPPDLVVGKIVSVEKKPSDLFQKAEMVSFVNLIDLSTVFVYTQLK